MFLLWLIVIFLWNIWCDSTSRVTKVAVPLMPVRAVLGSVGRHSAALTASMYAVSSLVSLGVSWPWECLGFPLALQRWWRTLQWASRGDDVGHALKGPKACAKQREMFVSGGKATFLHFCWCWSEMKKRGVLGQHTCQLSQFLWDTPDLFLSSRLCGNGHVSLKSAPTAPRKKKKRYTSSGTAAL